MNNNKDFYYLRTFSKAGDMNELSLSERFILSAFLSKTKNKDDRDILNIITNKSENIIKNWKWHKDFQDEYNKVDEDKIKYVIKNANNEKIIQCVKIDLDKLNIKGDNAFSIIVFKAFILGAANHSCNDKNDWFILDIFDWNKNIKKHRDFEIGRINDFLIKTKIYAELLEDRKKLRIFNKKTQIDKTEANENIYLIGYHNIENKIKEKTEKIKMKEPKIKEIEEKTEEEISEIRKENDIFFNDLFSKTKVEEKEEVEEDSKPKLSKIEKKIQQEIEDAKKKREEIKRNMACTISYEECKMAFINEWNKMNAAWKEQGANLAPYISRKLMSDKERLDDKGNEFTDFYWKKIYEIAKEKKVNVMLVYGVDRGDWVRNEDGGAKMRKDIIDELKKLAEYIIFVAFGDTSWQKPFRKYGPNDKFDDYGLGKAFFGYMLKNYGKLMDRNAENTVELLERYNVIQNGKLVI